MLVVCWPKVAAPFDVGIAAQWASGETSLSRRQATATLNVLNDAFLQNTAASPHVFSEEDLQRQKDESAGREAAKAKAGKPRQDAAWGRKGFYLRQKRRLIAILWILFSA